MISRLCLPLSLAWLCALVGCAATPLPAAEPGTQTSGTQTSGSQSSRPVMQTLYRPADDLAGQLSGTFSSVPQTEAEIAAGVPEDERHPALIATHIVFAGEGLGFEGPAVYAQLDRAGETGERRVYRQRIYLLASEGDGSVRMSVAEIAPDLRALTIDGPEAPLAALRAEDLILFDPGCDVIWTETPQGWSGVMDPELCKRVSARRGDVLSIGGMFSIAGNIFTHSEEGFYPDGTRLFGRTDGVPNVYTRVLSPDTGSQR